MAINDDILKNYIGRVLELKNRKDITAEDLQNIALELGITRIDLAEIEKTVHNHLVRGRNYLLHRCWDDAIGEFENALALNPLNADILYELAEAHYARGAGEKTKKDMEQAAALARDCIQYAPTHTKAYALLQKIHVPAGDPGRDHNKAGSTAIIAVIVFILFCCGFVAVFLFAPGKAPGLPQLVRTAESAAGSPAQTESIPAESAGLAEPAKKIKEEPGKRSLPVTLVKDDQTAHFTFTVREAVLNPYKGSFSFVLKADIVPTDIAIYELSLRTGLIDKTGVVRYAEIWDALSDYEPEVLPGNTLPAGILIYNKENDPGITRVQVNVSFLKQEPYTAAGISYPPKELTWLAPKPAGVALAAAERLNSLSGSSAMSYHRLTFEITNNGSRSIELLKLRVDWQAPDGADLAAIETYVTSIQDSTFLPGQTRIGFVIGSFRDVKPEADSYTVNVIEIR